MKTTNKDLAALQLNQVIEQLEQLLFCDLVMTYNDYASANHYELIHDNDEENINTLFETPYETAQAVVYGKYNPSDDYVTLDGYSNAVSFSYQLIQDDNCPIDISELAEWLINEDKLADYDITVVTLDDMLASIEDNISDNKYLLSKLADYLGQSLHTEQVKQLKTDDEYCEYLVSHFMNELDDYSYNDLYDLINTVGINYSVN